MHGGFRIFRPHEVSAPIYPGWTGEDLWRTGLPGDMSLMPRRWSVAVGGDEMGAVAVSFHLLPGPSVLS